MFQSANKAVIYINYLNTLSDQELESLFQSANKAVIYINLEALRAQDEPSEKVSIRQ